MSRAEAAPAALVFVEGESDRRALRAVALRLGMPLDDVTVLPLQGITNPRRDLGAVLAEGHIHTDRIWGLYDAAEQTHVAHVLADAGLIADDPTDPTAALRDAGFYGAQRDLEEEVIAAAGVPLVLAVLERTGDAARFRRFQTQPAQRGRGVEAQLHRFAGTAAGRKARFSADVVAALPKHRLPEALADLLRALAATLRSS